MTFFSAEPSPSFLSSSDTSKLGHHYEVVRPETLHCSVSPSWPKHCLLTTDIASPPTINTLQHKQKHLIAKISPHNVHHLKPQNRAANILPNTPGIKAASSNVLADKSFFNHVNECDNLEAIARSNDERCTQHSEVSSVQYGTESFHNSTKSV